MATNCCGKLAIQTVLWATLVLSTTDFVPTSASCKDIYGYNILGYNTFQSLLVISNHSFETSPSIWTPALEATCGCRLLLLHNALMYPDHILPEVLPYNRAGCQVGIYLNPTSVRALQKVVENVETDDNSLPQCLVATIPCIQNCSLLVKIFLSLHTSSNKGSKHQVWLQPKTESVIAHLLCTVCLHFQTSQSLLALPCSVFVWFSLFAGSSCLHYISISCWRK